MVTLSLSINDFQKNYGEVAFEACSLLARTQGDFSVGYFIIGSSNYVSLA